MAAELIGPITPLGLNFWHIDVGRAADADSSHHHLPTQVYKSRCALLLRLPCTRVDRRLRDLLPSCLAVAPRRRSSKTRSVAHSSKSLHHDVDSSSHHSPSPSGACRREQVRRSLCRLQQWPVLCRQGHILGFPGTKRGPWPDQPRHRRERRKGGAARCFPQQPVLLRSARRPHKGFQRFAVVPGLARFLPGLSANTSLCFPRSLRHQQGIPVACIPSAFPY